MPRTRAPSRRPVPKPKRRGASFAELAPLTEAILQHQRASNTSQVARRAEQGRILLEARGKLPRGRWRKYLETKLPFSRSTAERAIELHYFRERNPALFEKLCPVGLTMALLLIDRPVPEVEAFLRQAHRIPSLGVRKTPTAMTVAQAMEVLVESPDPPAPARLALTRSRRAGRRVITELRSLIEHRDAVDADDVAALYDDLVGALAELGVAFGLER